MNCSGLHICCTYCCCCYCWCWLLLLFFGTCQNIIIHKVQ